MALQFSVLTKLQRVACASLLRGNQWRLSPEVVLRCTSTDTQAPKPFTEIPKLGFRDQIAMFRASHQKQWHVFLEEMSGKYGPLFRCSMGGKGQAVICSSPRVLEAMFRGEEEYPLRLDFEQLTVLHEVMREKAAKKGEPLPELGFFALNGEAWHRQRSPIQKTFLRPKQLGAYADHLVQVADTTADNIRNLRADNGVVADLSYNLVLWSFEAVLNVLCDKSVSEFDIDLRALIDTVAKAQVRNEQLLFISPRLARSLRLRVWTEFEECFTAFRGGVQNVVLKRIEEARQDPTSEGLVPAMLASGLSEEEVVGGSLDMLGAALDTTANSAQFALYLLGRNPEVQEKLRHEVQTNCPEAKVDPACLGSMPYLKAAIKESMRIYAAAPLIGRRFARDTVLDGYNMPADSTIIFDVWTMCRNGTFFENPLEFQPERWLRSDKEQRVDPFTYVPFGIGKRSCIGRRVAEMNLQLLLIQILKRYQLSVSDSYELRPELRFLLVPGSPVPVAFKDL